MRIEERKELSFRKINSIVTETLKKSKFQINESSGPTGQQWEAMIAVALTNPKKPESVPEWKTAQKYWDDPLLRKQSLLLAKEFKQKFNVSVLSQLGDKRGAKLSSKWKSWGGTNNTPKTDLISGNLHISLKKVGGSQLISGLAGEMTATFEAAKETMGGNAVLKQELVEWIKNLGKKMPKLSYKGYVQDLNKLEKEYDWEELSPKQQDYIIEKNLLQESNAQLTKELDNFFQNSPGFKQAFCFEAVTGAKKFESKDAVANQLVEFDPVRGTFTKTLGVKKLKDVESIASSTKFYFSFKTSSGQASVSIRSAKLKSADAPFMIEGVDKSYKFKTFSEIVTEEYASLKPSVRSLIEGSLNENKIPINEFSLSGFLGNLYDQVKDAAPKVKDAILRFFKNITVKIQESIDYIITLGKKMIDGLLVFLGVEMSVESVEGEINNWW